MINLSNKLTAADIEILNFEVLKNYENLSSGAFQYSTVDISIDFGLEKTDRGMQMTAKTRHAYVITDIDHHEVVSDFNLLVLCTDAVNQELTLNYVEVDFFEKQITVYL